MAWLALVVIASDIMGYFAGRFIGGPKFWPKVSPKKTWSGTIAGWIGAALVGAVLMLMGQASAEIIGISIALAIAGQFGDVAESALKRQMGVKDSSNILPGHGGMFDRFDAMLGLQFFLRRDKTQAVEITQAQAEAALRRNPEVADRFFALFPFLMEKAA